MKPSITTADAPVALSLALQDAATRAHDALAVGRQMRAMLHEYTALEAQHATRLRALAQRMGDCVDHMRSAATAVNSADDEDDTRKRTSDQDGGQLESQCVAVMDEVVTFLTRFASMHNHLSECLAGDLFDEWSETLAVREKRLDAQEPALGGARQQLQVAEDAYHRAHDVFQEDFERACVLYAAAAVGDDKDDGDNGDDGEGSASDHDDLERAVRDELAALALSDTIPPRRTRSPSTAMQYVSRLLRSSGQGNRDARRPSIAGTNLSQPDPRTIAEAIAHAEHQREACHEAFQAMRRCHVRSSRLCDSIHQEYRCVTSECLASTRTSIRKLVIHVSAFTSNLQYDATQLFQRVESLHATDVASSTTNEPPSTSAFGLPSVSTTAYPPPPSNVPLALTHVIRRRFPVANERPRLLRHQNACHVLAV